MLNMNLLELMLVIATINSSITVSFIQKTKKYLNKSIYIPLYSFIINIVFGVFFSLTFTSLTFPSSIWIGIFSFLGSDTIYKGFEGKLSSYKILREEV